MSSPSWYNVTSVELLETSTRRLNIADEMSPPPPPPSSPPLISPTSSPLISLTDLLSMRDWETAMNHLTEHPTEACELKMLSLYGDLGDESRALPLHLACTFQPPSFVVKNLIEAYPDGIKTQEEKWGRLPLHFACIKKAGVDILTALIEAYPDAAQFKDDEGRIPIHYACCWGNTEEVRYLLMTCPRSIHVRDQGGKTPYDVTQMSGNPNKNSILRELQTVLQDASSTPTQLDNSFVYQPELVQRQNAGKPRSVDSGPRQSYSPRSTSFSLVASTDAERATHADQYFHQSLNNNPDSLPFDYYLQQRRRYRPVSTTTTTTIEQQTSTTSSLPHPSTIDNLIEKLVSIRIESTMQQQNIVQIDYRIDHLEDQKQQLTQNVTQSQKMTQSKFDEVSEHKQNLKMYTEKLEALLKQIGEEQRQLSHAEQELEKETEELSLQEDVLETVEEENYVLLQQRDCLLKDMTLKTEFMEELNNELEEHFGSCGVRREDVNFSCGHECE